MWEKQKYQRNKNGNVTIIPYKKEIDCFVNTKGSIIELLSFCFLIRKVLIIYIVLYDSDRCCNCHLE